MKVVTPKEMAAVDRAAIKSGIPGIVLMENAGKAATHAAMDMISYDSSANAAIWCGKGNNGGDGFVIARLLDKISNSVSVFLLCRPSELKGDALENYNRIAGTSIPIHVTTDPVDLERSYCEMKPFSLVIDAIFGTGFSGEPTGIHRAAIEKINEVECPVLSVDIPSGVSGETGAVPGVAVRADRTVTFAAPKVGLVQYPGKEYAGELDVADIGIPMHFLQEVPETNIETVEGENADLLLPGRRPDAHKGDSGRVLVVGGAPGMTGAPAMSARASLRTGAGLVTLGVPEGLHDIFEIKLTEVMTRPYSQTADRTFSLMAADEILKVAGGFDALAVGPGISVNDETAKMVRKLVAEAEVPVVLDADGLNAMIGHTDIFKDRKGSLVITPHPGEMSRLLGMESAAIQADRVGTAAAAAKNWEVIVVLKGANTVTADMEGRVRINSSGNPGMASAGMGDVLTGCIASLIAQGCSVFDAAVAGVYFHGYSADLVASMDGMTGMVASDVIRHLPLALRKSGRL
ncbi:MAG: NAD(P)H-hydrate dehydratase [Actinobacteria bacterium]|nr:NAD(P)H-hydrate dehydratase [Actinomycetota bacterium]